MVKLAANLSTLFQEHAFLDRFAAAAAAGFRYVECQQIAPEPPAEIARELRAHGLQLVLFNAPAGAADERGVAANPARADEFEQSIAVASLYARATGCPRVHIQAGLLPAGADRGEWRTTLVGRLRNAADRLAPLGLEVMLEPINTKVDMPGYFYGDAKTVIDVIDEIARPNVKLQLDLYHAQIMHGDLARTLERLLPRIGHIQIADNPGRHEPGTGEINYPWMLERLDALGYDGFVGCEYFPSTTTEAGLAWARPYLSTTV